MSICPYYHNSFINNEHEAYESILEHKLLDYDKDGFCFVKCLEYGRIFAVEV